MSVLIAIAVSIGIPFMVFLLAAKVVPWAVENDGKPFFTRKR